MTLRLAGEKGDAICLSGSFHACSERGLHAAGADMTRFASAPTRAARAFAFTDHIRAPLRLRGDRTKRKFGPGLRRCGSGARGWERAGWSGMKSHWRPLDCRSTSLPSSMPSAKAVLGVAQHAAPRVRRRWGAAPMCGCLIPAPRPSMCAAGIIARQAEIAGGAAPTARSVASILPPRG